MEILALFSHRIKLFFYGSGAYAYRILLSCSIYFRKDYDIGIGKGLCEVIKECFVLV